MTDALILMLEIGFVKSNSNLDDVHLRYRWRRSK